MGPFLIVSVGCINNILGFDVSVEIEAGNVVIATIGKSVKDWVDNLSITEEAGFDGLEDSLQFSTKVISLTLIKLLSNFVYAIYSFSENEHVLFAYLFSDLDVGAIHGTNNKTTVHNEFHVGCSRGFSTSSGNMLRELGSWDNDLSARNVVVWQEDDLKKVSNLWVVVYLEGNGGNQLDDSLGVMVTWGSFTTDHDNSWDEFVSSLVLWGIEDCEISVNDIKDVHELSLVLMNSLNLDIEHRITGDFETGSFLDPCSKFGFVLLLDGNEFLLEGFIASIWFELVKVVKGGDPLINATKGITDKIRELWVAAMDPSSWGNTVGLVLNFTWVEVIEFLENGSLQELGVKGSDTVNGVRTDDTEIGHSNLLGPSLFDETHSTNLLSISWVLLLELSNVDMVDEVNKLKMSWEQSSDELNGPLLEGLWQDCVVGVREGLVADVPCFLESKTLLIDKDSQKFDGTDSWMSIIKLDLIFIGKHSESIVVSIFISSNDIVDGGGAEEILLLQSELLTGISGVVWVKDTGDVFGILSLANSTVIITGVELVEIEGASWSGFPKSQVVGVISVETWNWGIISHSDDLLAALPFGSLGVTVLVLVGDTIESNIIGNILSFDLPWVSVIKPKVWNFSLISIFNDLLENTIVVSNTITPSWNFKGSERIDEACGESSKTTITKGSISFLFIELLEIITHIHESISEWTLEIRVDESILKSSTHQKFKREVIDSLAILVLVELLSIVPGFNESISDGQSASLIGTEIIEVESGSSEGIFDVINNLSLNGLLVVTEIRLHQLPHLLVSLLHIVVLELGSIQNRVFILLKVKF